MGRVSADQDLDQLFLFLPICETIATCQRSAYVPHFQALIKSYKDG